MLVLKSHRPFLAISLLQEFLLLLIALFVTFSFKDTFLVWRKSWRGVTYLWNVSFSSLHGDGLWLSLARKIRGNPCPPMCLRQVSWVISAYRQPKSPSWGSLPARRVIPTAD